MRVYSRIVRSQNFILVVGVFVLIGILVLPAMAFGRFVNNGDGTITDMKTGLMWATRDNGIPINWPNALYYCHNYSAGGHSDWRMPTLDELESLYNPKVKNNNGYHVTKLIITTASSCWALETRNFLAGRFNFTYGKVYWLRQYYSGPTRVLPVRSGN